MTRPPFNDEWMTPDSADVNEDDGAAFDYLDEGAISPPKPAPRLTRVMSRRGFIAAAAASFAGVAAIGVPLNTEGAFYPGTLVSDLDISELRYPEAMQRLHAHLADFENTAIDYSFEGQTWNASLAELGYSIDYDATLNAAWEHGRDAGVVERYAGVLWTPNRRQFPVVFREDTAILERFLDNIGTQIIGAARDARLFITGSEIGIIPNVDGRQLDKDAAVSATQNAISSANRREVRLQAQAVVSQITIDDLEQYRDMAQTMIGSSVLISSSTATWSITPDMLQSALVLPPEGKLIAPTFDEATLSASLQAIADEVHADPANAILGWDNGLYVVQDDVKGQELDVPRLVADVTERARDPQNRQVRASFQDILATVRTDNTDTLGIVDTVGAGDSSFVGSSEARAANVRISAEHLTHTLVEPGGTYSFNQAIGPITLDNGFVEGKIIRGSWIVSDIGGGACQASTTVFRAALDAGFEIQHTPHQFRLAFYELDGWPPGLDAAIYQPNDEGEWETDMTFTNSTENWLLVEMSANEDHAYCTIYGTPQGIDVSVDVPYVSPPKDPGPPVEEESSQLAKDQREKVQDSSPGYDVQAIRTISQDGTIIGNWEFWSFFQPQQEKWMIGPGTKRKFDNTTPTPTSNP